MIQDTITDNMANAMLRQMGATSIITKPAYINIVKFDISEELSITYLYELKENEGIYLQRQKPYPMYISEPADENELVETIKADIDKFKDALTSSNFSKFIVFAEKAAEVNKKMEELLLSPKNVETSDIDKVNADLDQIEADVARTGSNAK